MEVIHETPHPFLVEYGIEFFLEERANMGVIVYEHIHPAVEFLYIKEGIFDIEVEHRRLTARPGDLVLFHSNAIHLIANADEGRGRYYVLKLAPDLLLQMFPKDIFLSILPLLGSHNGERGHYPLDCQSLEIRRLWQAMITEYEAGYPTFFSMQRLLACEFLLTFVRTYMVSEDDSDTRITGLSERTITLMYKSVHYINENFALPLTAAGCASLVHLSYSHYAKLFRTVVGKSFKEYLTDIRLAQAYNMLLSSPLPISDIASACGYDSLSYFIAGFKKLYGKTPGDLRRTFRLTMDDEDANSSESK